MKSLMITGATGFIGRSLLRQLAPAKYEHVYCLGRTPSAAAESHAPPDGFRFIKGDLCEPEAYADYLAGCESVVHLAATTGKAARDEYFKVNTEGTRLLVEECRRRGVRNFLYVSTIAVKYPDKTRYYYAQSKEQGERVVRDSGLNYTIVRPTIVIGAGAAAWAALSAIARKPVILLPGDGTARIQPIYIEDLVRGLLTVLDDALFAGETYELGGPEEITFEHFLRRIHSRYYRREPPVVHLPLKPLVAALGFVEEHLGAVLPVSAGQLAAFSNDGTVAPNTLHRRLVSQMKDVEQMLRQVIAS